MILPLWVTNELNEEKIQKLIKESPIIEERRKSELEDN
jgi:hypothetical protein